MPCWKRSGDKGFDYKDPDAAADGVKRIQTRAGAQGKGKVKVQAANKAKKDQLSLPTGVAQALDGAAAARLQVLATGGECIDAELADVRRADGVIFKARTP